MSFQSKRCCQEDLYFITITGILQQKRNSRSDRSFFSGKSFGRRKLLFAYSADFANEIIREVFPLCALLVFVILPAAHIAYVNHFLYPAF